MSGDICVGTVLGGNHLRNWAGAALIGVWLGCSAAASASIELVSRIEGEPLLDTRPNQASDTDISSSADGRFVAFSSRATNLASGDTNASTDVFVYDRQSDSIELLTRGGNSGSGSVSMSGDARFVTFHSSASNLVPGDVNNQLDIFVYDRDTDTIERLTAGGDFRSVFPEISADGRFVVFESSATNLVPADTNERTDVFIHDRDNGTTKLVTAGATALAVAQALTRTEDSWPLNLLQAIWSLVTPMEDPISFYTMASPTQPTF